MGIRKTGLDCRREQVALDISKALIGTGISVSSGGKLGPYRVTVSYLNRKEMLDMVKALRVLAEFSRVPSGVDPDDESSGLIPLTEPT